MEIEEVKQITTFSQELVALKISNNNNILNYNNNKSEIILIIIGKREIYF